MWVTDSPYYGIFAGWAYGAFVLDVLSGRVVGWQGSESLRTDLALVLEMGIWMPQHAGQRVTGMTRYSDRGV